MNLKPLQNVITWIESNAVTDDPGHDLAHLKRVVGSCQYLGQRLNADMDILLPAAYLHDVITVPKNHPDRIRASAMAADKAKELLRGFGYEAEVVERIAQVIKEHSYSAGHQPSSLESAILQDADRLDALGALGIMRTITCGAQMKARYYHSEEPVAETRPLDDKAYSLDHFYCKLFLLADKMNTPLAKELAQQRTDFMKRFVEQLVSEVVTR